MAPDGQVAMHPKPIRRFTIADMLVLVMASAVVMLILHAYMPEHFPARDRRTWTRRGLRMPGELAIPFG